MKVLNIIAIGLFIVTSAVSQSIRINEFSQGLSGAKEWVELLVTSTTPVGFNSCSTVKLNIANWILDDNNGDFSPTNHFTGTGIATGHMRFKNQAPWNNLPVGSIIVIYNAADKDLVSNFPADDPTDTNGDCVYVVPSNHASLEYCTTLPLATSCTIRSNYSVCTYTATGTWANVGLANAGDAIQVRDPSYNLIHGLVYGRATSASGCTTTDPMVGNALAPVVTASAMSGTSAAFNGTTAADFYDATKWVVQSASLATPGWTNNLNDSLYIKNSVRGGCTCSQVLPINSLVETNASRSSRNSITFDNNAVITSMLEMKAKQHVYLYDGTGRLLYSTAVNVERLHKLCVKERLSNGLNLIKIATIYSNGVQDVTVFKYIKNK